MAARISEQPAQRLWLIFELLGTGCRARCTGACPVALTQPLVGASAKRQSCRTSAPMPEVRSARPRRSDERASRTSFKRRSARSTRWRKRRADNAPAGPADRVFQAPVGDARHRTRADELRALERLADSAYATRRSASSNCRWVALATASMSRDSERSVRREGPASCSCQSQKSGPSSEFEMAPYCSSNRQHALAHRCRYVTHNATPRTTLPLSRETHTDRASVSVQGLGFVLLVRLAATREE